VELQVHINENTNELGMKRGDKDVWKNQQKGPVAQGDAIPRKTGPILVERAKALRKKVISAGPKKREGAQNTK